MQIDLTKKTVNSFWMKKKERGREVHAAAQKFCLLFLLNFQILSSENFWVLRIYSPFRLKLYPLRFFTSSVEFSRNLQLTVMPVMMRSGFMKGVSLWYDIISRANDVVTLYWKYKDHISILLRYSAPVLCAYNCRKYEINSPIEIFRYKHGNCPTSRIYDQPQYDSNRCINRSALCSICVREINRIKLERDFYYKYVVHEINPTQVDEVDFTSLFITKLFTVKSNI